RAVETKSPWTSLAYTMLFGALMLLVLWLGSGALGFVSTAETNNIVRAVGEGVAPWLALLVLALGPTLGGYALFTIALRHIPGRVASIVVMLEAPASVLLSVALLGERLEWPQIVGMSFILVGACLPALLSADRRTAAKRSLLAPNEPLADV